MPTFREREAVLAEIRELVVANDELASKMAASKRSECRCTGAGENVDATTRDIRDAATESLQSRLEISCNRFAESFLSSGKCFVENVRDVIVPVNRKD